MRAVEVEDGWLDAVALAHADDSTVTEVSRELGGEAVQQFDNVGGRSFGEQQVRVFDADVVDDSERRADSHQIDYQ